MKALVYTDVETLEYQEVLEPIPAQHEKLVHVEAVGICGSDMHAYLGHDDRRPAPLILGHEAAGYTADGLRVAINPLVTCGTCRSCGAGRENLCENRQIISMPPRAGAFAQMVAMPDRNLIRVPDHISLDQAALAEPIAVSWHAVRLGLSAAHEDMKVSALIIGGGAIGVAAALCLQAKGIGKILLIESNPARRAYLYACTTFEIASPDAAEGRLYDIVVDAVGYDATRAAASRLAHPGGVILHIGLGGGIAGIDTRRATLQEITFIGTYTYTAQDFKDTCVAMFDGRLGSLDWFETRPLSEGGRAFSDIRAGHTAAPKIILKP